MPNLLYTMGLTYSLFYAIHSHSVHYQRLLTLPYKLGLSTFFLENNLFSLKALNSPRTVYIRICFPPS